MCRRLWNRPSRKHWRGSGRSVPDGGGTRPGTQQGAERGHDLQSGGSETALGLYARRVSWRHLGRCCRASDPAVDGAATSNPKLVAVLPFRISGSNPDLAWLREGLVDLLAIKLTGVEGLHAAEPSAVLGAWRRVAGSRGETSRRRPR
jgi:hypothetical protein